MLEINRGFRKIRVLTLSFHNTIVSFFFQDRKEDFDNRIDAPAESMEALYGEALHTQTTP